jgi:hypothetical protein
MGGDTPCITEQSKWLIERKLCRMRTATLCETLATLKDQGAVLHGPSGYSLAKCQCKTAVSFPDILLQPPGNGKRETFTPTAS